MAAFTPPAIISCDTWGAKVTPPNRVMINKAIGIVIHHTATDNVDVSRLSDAALQLRAFAFAKSIQLDHIHRGYGDSGQHFTVTRDGLIMEGRRGSLAALQSGTSMISGAHTSGGTDVNQAHRIHFWNDGYIGIENEGTYRSELPPDALWDSLILLCAFIVSQYGFWPLRILGHRDFNKTACPGEALYGQIGSLRRNVATLVQGGVDW